MMHARSGTMRADPACDELEWGEFSGEVGEAGSTAAPAPTAVFTLDTRGVVIAWDERGNLLMQQPASAGCSAFELFASLRAHRRGHGSCRVDDLLRRALDGEESDCLCDVEGRTLELRLVPLRGGGGSFVGVTGLVTDLSARLRADAVVRDERRRTRTVLEALARSEQSFRALIEALPDFIVVHRAGEIVYANPSVVHALGYASDEALVGQPVVDLTLPGDEDAVLSCSERTRTIRLRGPSERDCVVEVVALALPFDGELATVVVGRDVTERAHAEAQLLRADRLAALGTLASGVAHEINNPLTYVLGNVEFVVRRLRAHAAKDDPALVAPDALKLAEALSHAIEGVHRVRATLRDLMTFAHGNVNERSLVDVRAVLNSAIQMAWHEIRHRAKLVRQLNDIPPVEANEARLGQVFLNLLVNAAQAIPEGAADKHEVRVVTRTGESGEAIIEISDTGEGMPQEVAARVFDPFFTTRSGARGGGLGLSISHGIVRELGGDIELRSAPGRGSSFTLLLPSAKGWRASHPSIRIARLAEDRARVLIVDDDRLVGEAMALTLGDENDVTLLTSAREALEHLSQGARFDTILCDLMMPNMTGMDLYTEALRVAPDAVGSIVFITGGAFTSRARAFLDGVNVRCLEKPIDAKELRELIRQRRRSG